MAGVLTCTTSVMTSFFILINRPPSRSAITEDLKVAQVELLAKANHANEVAKQEITPHDDHLMKSWLQILN